MSTTAEVPNGNGTTAAPLSPTASILRVSPPPEIEATLARLSAYRNVRGVMILARGAAGNSGIVQSTGAVFDGDSGRRYAGALETVVNTTAGAIAACEDGDELRLMRIRTKRHELIITPDERYLLVVLQDPGL